jgi:peroxiredoxin
LSAIQADLAQFAGLNAQVVGVNTDTVFSHVAFQKSLGGLSFPLASDRWPYAKTAEAYGIFPATRHDFAFVNDRAVFIVDKGGKIAWSKIYELGQQPDNAEILDALRKVA